MKIALVAHAENTELLRRALPELLPHLRGMKTNWMLECGDAIPYRNFLAMYNDGKTLESTSSLFRPLLKRGDELGLHIHFLKNGSWDPSPKNQERLIKAGRERFRKKFGFFPLSFVSGNWYIDDATARILAKYGFRCDASCVPGFSQVVYKRVSLGPLSPITPFKIRLGDWRDCDKHKPFRLGKLLEIPNAALGPFRKEWICMDWIEDNLDSHVDVFQRLSELTSVIAIPFHPQNFLLSSSHYKLRRALGLPPRIGRFNENRIRAFHSFIERISENERVEFIRLSSVRA